MLPKVTLLDLKVTPRQKGSPLFTKHLVEALHQRLVREEQSILFLNRRGYANIVQCPECETTVTCNNCSLSLVYHHNAGLLKCHQCDYQMAMPQYCPYCHKRTKLKIHGLGTEQVEAELKIIFPNARLLRMDRDTLHGKHALSRMLNKIRNHEVDIIVGTQMVTKGHDFPNITLVGVILADISLNIPDFRAGERTFQLLAQVTGRAGRGDKPGEVLIQTYNPNHHSLQCAQNHAVDRFREIELNQRQQLKWPPYLTMVALTFSSLQENRAEALSQQFGENVRRVQGIEFSCLGPIEAPIKKIKNRYRWIVILKGPHISNLHHILNQALHTPHPLTLRMNDRISIDVDPYHLL